MSSSGEVSSVSREVSFAFLRASAMSFRFVTDSYSFLKSSISLRSLSSLSCLSSLSRFSLSLRSFSFLFLELSFIFEAVSSVVLVFSILTLSLCHIKKY